MLHKTVSRQETHSLSQRQEKIFAFLDRMRVGVLTSVDPNGDPHGSVIYFIVDDDFSIRFLTKNETKKAENLLHNNRVMLVVFDQNSQTVAQVIGKTARLTDSTVVNQIAAKVFMHSIKNSQGSLLPIAKLDAGDYIGYCITPDQIRMASYAKAGTGDYKKLFDSIESFELHH